MNTEQELVKKIDRAYRHHNIIYKNLANYILVYGDWLEENGRDVEAAVARMVAHNQVYEHQYAIRWDPRDKAFWVSFVGVCMLFPELNVYWEELPSTSGWSRESSSL